MTYQEFEESLKNNFPPLEINEILTGLWHDAKGEWEAAHNVAQSREGNRAYDHLHAYLHRAEGDSGNANYWYRRAGVKVPENGLKEEWEALVKANMEK